MSKGRHARRRRFDLRSLWRRNAGTRRRAAGHGQPLTQVPPLDAEVVALRQRLAAVEEYANQVTQELNQLRAQVAEYNAATAGLQTEPSFAPPAPPTFSAPAPSVVEQIELPDTPPIWAGPPPTQPVPAESWAGSEAAAGPVASNPAAADEALSLDIPLLVPSPAVSPSSDQPRAPHVARAPLIDVVPTVTRRAG